MDTLIPDAAQQPRVQVTTASGFVVVSWWADNSRDDRKGSFQYDHYKTLNSALDAYEEFQNGEWSRAREMGVFSCDEAGLPLHRLDPARLMQLMHEQRSGR